MRNQTSGRGIRGVIGGIGMLSLIPFSHAAHGTEGGASGEGLMPQRLYYQVGHPVTATIPEGESREIVFLDPDNTEVARGTVSDGSVEVDLAQVYDELFELDEVTYAQLFADGEPTGSALVLQPLIDKYRPVIRYVETSSGRTPVINNWTELAPAEQVMSGFRIYRESRPVLHTTKGDIVLVMRPDEAPDTVWNFRHLIEGGFYTNIPFHRIVETDRQGSPFVIQAGDPSGTGAGGCAYEIDMEPSDLPHDFGVISMARRGDSLDSASSQFFICLSRAGTSRLDGQYCSFGQTLDGTDVIEALARVPVDNRDRPLEMPYIERAELRPAPPRTPGERPSWMSPVKRQPVEESSTGLPPENVDR